MAVTPLKQLLPPEQIESLASRSNLRLGKQIAKDAKIMTQTSNIFRRIAVIYYKNNPPRTVELLSNSKGLRYTCTCTARKNMFCEHCIAIALALHEV